MIEGRVVIEKITSRLYALRSDLTYEDENFKITVGEGVITDGASIPRVFWSIFGGPFSGKYLEGAIIHDALYAKKAVSRREADVIFYKMMVCNGTKKRKAIPMYLAVRLFGWVSYGTGEKLIDNDSLKVIRK